MTAHESTQDQSAKELVPPLLLGTMGTLGVVAAYFLVPGFTSFDAVILLIPVAFGAIGFRWSTIQGLVSALFFYLSTGIAATFHVAAAPFIGAPFSATVDNSIRALSFAVLAIAIWIALEVITRALIPDTSLPAIGILDNLGALMIYVAIGIVVACVTFNALGFSSRWKRRHDAALLRPEYNRVNSYYFSSQSFWFSGHPPRLYIYDLE